MPQQTENCILAESLLRLLPKPIGYSPANMHKCIMDILMCHEISVDNLAQDSTKNGIEDDVSRVQKGLGQSKLLSTGKTYRRM